MVVAALLVADVTATALHDSSHRGRTPARTTSPPSSSTPTTISLNPDRNGYVRAPRPGLYRYHDSGVAPGSTGFEWAERVTALPSPADTTVDHILTTTGIDSIVQFTPTAELQLAYSQAGTSVATEVACQVPAPVLLLQLPLQAGSTWNSMSSCTDLLGDKLVTVSTSQVMGATTQPSGDQIVPAWEVVTVAHQSEIPTRGKTVNQTVTTTLDISARYGLVIRQVTQDGSDPSTIRTDQLTTIVPA